MSDAQHTNAEHQAPIPLAPGEHPPFEGAYKVAGPVEAGRHHQSTRTKARKAALDVLFEADLLGRDPLELLEELREQSETPPREFTELIVRGVHEHRREIDSRISRCVSSDWSLERMPRIDRNLARIAVWEMDHTGIAGKVAISEALELADQYSTDTSVAFLHGMLSKALDTRPESNDG